MRPICEQVVLVTGATDGLGKRIARDLATQGATVLLHGRDRTKGAAAIAEIQEQTGNANLRYYSADFASLAEVRRLASAVTATHDQLDLLVNNAGIGGGYRDQPREMSVDGHELRFAVNYLAPFLLTYQLVPLLRRSAPARVVNVASVGQQPLDFDDVMLEKAYDGLRAYRQSKLAQVMFTFDLADKLRGTRVTVNALHPASLMDTRMVRDTDYFAEPLTSVDDGAYSVLYLAASPDVEGESGEYYDGKQRARAHPQVYDRQARRKLRMLSLQLVGLSEATG